jgi:hypothetical protein
VARVGLLRLTCATLGFAISRRFIPVRFQPWVQLARLTAETIKNLKALSGVAHKKMSA